MKRPCSLAVLIASFAVLLFGIALLTHAADPGEGKKLYGQYCGSCHGESGKGDGPAATALNPKPRNHTDKEYMSKLSDEDMLKVIKGGGASVGKSPIMPPWGAALKDDQIKDVIAYIRTLCCK
jgi:cytochrome c oxidase cbb3-type subunit 3